MRERLRALYYPDFVADFETLKKCILLFDEVHFMDRPSFTFSGTFGLIGAQSPLRAYEQSFRDEGVPFYVHEAPGGPVQGGFLEKIEADISDRQFLARFQEGLRASVHFRNLHIWPGDYGNGETHETIFKKVAAIDLERYPPPLELFYNRKILPFETSTPDGVFKILLFDAAHCSAKMNFALEVGARHGFSPLADASPYTNLLSAKYSRALNTASEGGQQVPATDLSLAILDELVQPGRLSGLKVTDVVRYRKESETAREAFLEQLLTLQAKFGDIPPDGDYKKSIEKIVLTEIRPAAREFQNRLDKIYDKLFGSIVTGVMGLMGTSAAVQVLGDLSWPNLLRLAGGVGAFLGTQAVSALVETRSAHREYAISYLLDIEGRH